MELRTRRSAMEKFKMSFPRSSTTATPEILSLTIISNTFTTGAGKQPSGGEGKAESGTICGYRVWVPSHESIHSLSANPQRNLVPVPHEKPKNVHLTALDHFRLNVKMNSTHVPKKTMWLLCVVRICYDDAAIAGAECRDQFLHVQLVGLKEDNAYQYW